MWALLASVDVVGAVVAVLPSALAPAATQTTAAFSFSFSFRSFTSCRKSPYLLLATPGLLLSKS